MQKVKILLVDDRKENLFSLGSLLDDPEVEIYKAVSGSEALSLMVDYDFALAILDVQMPEMDGFELAELMRGAEKTKSIPIMFVTAASPASGFAFKGYESGAVDFLYKPIDPQVLKSKVHVFIQLEMQKIQLRLAKESAENANKLKSSFLANMSHEIRTPLGALIGFTELLDDETLSPESRNSYIQTIKRNGQVLLDLINDILDLSKVEAGHLKMEREPTCPVTISRDVLSSLKVVSERKGLDLKLKIADDVPRQILSDAKRFRQILMNIIGNAIKFTEKGFVEVSISADSLSSISSRITVRVRDTGIGITHAQADRLFSPFIQADDSMTRKFGGTGLGLALSRKLAQMLGGDVALESSEAGKGSVFAITIVGSRLKDELADSTRAQSSVSDAGLNSAASLKNIRVLIVEDSADNQALMEIVLKRKGADIEFANNGVEGYQKALSSDYDVVLMDIQMPVQDGYITVQKLREKKYHRPIIALTAHAMADEKEKCLKIGCNDYLSKPINQKQLIEKIYVHAKQV